MWQVGIEPGFSLTHFAGGKDIRVQVVSGLLGCEACRPQVSHVPALCGAVCTGMWCACTPMSECAGPCHSAWGLVPPSHYAP